MIRTFALAVLFAWSTALSAAKTKPVAVPDLPEAFSSFGAASLDGYVYVYGGHAGKTHSYARETTLGKFRRLKIDAPEKGWEELAAGTHLQGAGDGPARDALCEVVVGERPRRRGHRARLLLPVDRQGRHLRSEPRRIEALVHRDQQRVHQLENPPQADVQPHSIRLDRA